MVAEERTINWGAGLGEKKGNKVSSFVKAMDTFSFVKAMDTFGNLYSN